MELLTLKPRHQVGLHARYKLKQHNYAAGESGYIEVLEIKNPPDGRCGIIIKEYNNFSGGVFTEWSTVEDACVAFDKFWNSPQTTEEQFPKLSGFRRRVVCGELTPWFYAIGDELLIGDYSLPKGFQDDPFYRFGRKFVVSDRSGFQRVKTCMGTRLIKRDSHGYFLNDEQYYRLIYWDDGTVLDQHLACENPPRLLKKGEEWIVEAFQQFQQVLAGQRTEVEIKFTDGDKFVGKLIRKSTRLK
jgi:hypothetical protein